MKRKNKESYEGVYRISRQPRSLKSHNAVSWKKIEKLVASKSDGKASFNQLSTVVKGHKHCGEDVNNPYQFIIYCINSGWLERV